MAPLALAAAAAYFTLGGSLTLGGMTLTGGWSGAVSTLMGSMGIGSASTLGSILTSAVTYAGYGAMAGAAGGALGGDISGGALAGAGIGALTGGAMGAFNSPMFQSTMTQPQATAARHQAAGVLDRVAPSTPVQAGNIPTGHIQQVLGTPSAAGMIAQPTASNSGLFGAGGWLERNQMLLAPLVQGIGAGISGSAGGGGGGGGYGSQSREPYGMSPVYGPYWANTPPLGSPLDAETS